MGNNYYIQKKNRLPNEDLIHIGKSVSVTYYGLFIWDIKPSIFLAQYKNKDTIIVDESGHQFGFDEFHEIITPKKWDYDHIGTNFS
ncbi:MAG: hypothetical protein Q8N08_04410 [Methanobacteriaceae archaeon]|nr:hypothetical protein [Methanobacteriaceae archaeon]